MSDQDIRTALYSYDEFDSRQYSRNRLSPEARRIAQELREIRNKNIKRK